MVREYAAKAGIEKLAPQGLRRTCARLCHASGGELEQIQFLLGHVSIQTTERYLGCKQRIQAAVNDKIGNRATGLNEPLTVLFADDTEVDSDKSVSGALVLRAPTVVLFPNARLKKAEFPWSYARSYPSTRRQNR